MRGWQKSRRVGMDGIVTFRKPRTISCHVEDQQLDRPAASEGLLEFNYRVVKPAGETRSFYGIAGRDEALTHHALSIHVV
jgi:hypothetical protein